jgi:hypothetical protein
MSQRSLPAPLVNSGRSCFNQFAVVACRFVAGVALSIGLSSPAAAALPSEFSTEYLDGKEFFAIPFDDTGAHPLELFRLAFTASTFDFEDLVPVDESGTISYTIDNGDIVFEDERIVLVESHEDYLQCRIFEPDEDPGTILLYFTRGDADAVLAAVDALRAAAIEIDGDFFDWTGVPEIVGGNGTSDIVNIQSVRYTTDGRFFYFFVEADRNIPDVFAGGTGRVLWVELNHRY